jgi:hypothetical protein
MYKVTKIGIGFLFICCSITEVSAQLAQKIGDQPFVIDKSAVFELQSVTKGFLPPRMTTSQRDDIYKPAKGLIIFNVSINGLEVNAGSLDTPLWVATTVANPAITALKTEDYTISGSDSTVLFDATAKNLTATLPDATALVGKIFYVRKDDISSKTLTIVPNLRISGVLTTLVLNYAKTIKVQSNGTDWVVID